MANIHNTMRKPGHGQRMNTETDNEFWQCGCLRKTNRKYKGCCMRNNRNRQKIKQLLSCWFEIAEVFF